MPRSPTKDAANISRRIRAPSKTSGRSPPGFARSRRSLTCRIRAVDLRWPGRHRTRARQAGRSSRGALRTELAAIDSAARKALQEYQPLEPSRIVPPLLEGLEAVRAARQALSSMTAPRTGPGRCGPPAVDERAGLHRSRDSSAGIVVDPLADTETVVPGGRVPVNVRVFLSQPSTASVVSMTVKAPSSWAVKPAGERDAQAGRFRREVPSSSARYEVSVPTAAIAQPISSNGRVRGDGDGGRGVHPRALRSHPHSCSGG